MKPYSSYKDSGIAWIGQIPSHWETDKIGAHFDERKEKVSDKDYEPLSVTKDGIVPQLADAAKTDNGDNRKLVCAGDFVVNSRSDRKSSCGVSPSDGSVSLIYIILAPRDINRSYIHYLFRSNDYVEEFYRNGRGIVADLWTTRYSEMKNIFIPVPPADEQEAIVWFITEKSEKIDRYIAEQERLLAALDELRQAEIARTVTRGLNPDAPLRDSGIDWIGTIPAHWELINLKRKVNLVNDKTEDKNLPYVGLENVESFIGKVINVGSTIPDSTCNAFIAGDILFCKLRPYLTKCVLANFEGKCTSELLVLREFEGVSKFLQYILLSPKCIDYINASTYGSKMPRANWQFIGNMEIPIPPLDEQSAIVEYLDEKTAKIDRMKADIEKQIGLLKEYKQRLISDAVTGKIDVRV